jgi:hypothetical protein
MLTELVELSTILLAALVTLGAHEIGHLLGGKAGGLRFGLFIVGPLYVQRGADDRVYWRLNRRLVLAGGAATCVPEGQTDLRRAYMRMVAGGPLISLGLGVLALALLIAMAVAGPATDGLFAHPAALVLLTVAGGSLSIGLGTLIPINRDGFVSDGARILQLMRQGPEAERHAAVMALGSYHISGRRPRDWNPALVRGAVSLSDGSYTDAMGHYLAYHHALDRGDPEAAEAHVRSLVALADAVPAPFRPVIELEAAYFASAYGRCEDLGLKPPKEVGKSLMVDGHARRRAEAAALLAEGETKDALVKLRAIHRYMARNEALDESAFIMAEIERLCLHWGLPQPPSADGRETREGVPDRK